MSINKDEIDTSDYKLDKRGRKTKAHRIVFKNGEDDGTKGIKEGSMKKTFNSFIEEHTLPLTEEQLNEIVAELQEVLGKDDPAGKWISDFVHSDNPKFAGKSKEKRKQMALAAYYANQRNEEVELQEKYDHEKHNPFKHDTDKGANESDREHIAKHKPAHVIHDHENEVEHHVHYHNGHTLVTSSGHYQNSDTVKLKGKHSKAHIAGAIHHFNTHDESVDIIGKLTEAYDANDYEASSEKSQFGGHRAIVKHKTTGKVSYAGGTAYKSAEHAKGEAETYRTHYSVGSGKMTPGANLRHDRAVSDYRKKAKEAGHLREGWNDMLAHVKKTGEATKTSTATKHDVKKTSTGTVYTKQRDADGHSKEFNRSGEATQKRGRGRPKKNSFGEAVEFLMTLSEEQFDEFMSEGFDSFFETYDQLDEVSKTTLVSYVKKATNGMSGVAINAHQAGGAAPGSKERKTFLAKANKRIDGIAKAADRLTK